MRGAVYNDAPGLYLARHRRSPNRIGRDDIGLQSIGCVVGNRNSLCLILIGQQAQNRAKNFLPGDCHVIGDIREHGRLYEVTGETVRMALATSDDGSACFDAKPDIALNPIVLDLAYHWSNGGAGVAWVTRLDFLEGGSRRCYRFIRPRRRK